MCIIIAVLMFIFNPNESQIRSHLAEKGWLPVRIERANLLLLSVTTVTGVTGAKGLFIGIGGQIFGGETGNQ